MSVTTSRSADQMAILQSLLSKLPGYTPEWTLSPGSKGFALFEVLARYQALLEIGAADLPEHHLLAFLDTLGISLLPAQASRAPVVFQLVANAPVDVTVASDSQLAAIPVSPPASPITSDSGTVPAPVLFFTEQTITLTRAKLATLYSIDPGNDAFTDHSAFLEKGFTVFGEMARTEHALYLGHDRLFKLGGSEITLLLQCSLEDSPEKPLDIHWQYLSEAGWITLQRAVEEDTTRGLTRSGQIALRLSCGPDAKKETFYDRSSYWLRGTLNTPVIRGENLRHNPLTINDLRVRVRFNKSDLLPEAAFADSIPLDVSKAFYPFGQQPNQFSTFYLASTEVFQRAGARVHLDITLAISNSGRAITSLIWEYYSNSGWMDLPLESNTYKFDKVVKTKASLTFHCPGDWQENEVSGTKNFWLRVRITEGSFTTPKTVQVGVDINNHNAPIFAAYVEQKPAPVISTLKLSYSYITDPEMLDYCLTRNDFIFEDHTDDALWPNRRFDPFWPVADQQPTLHFDFDQALPSGLVSLYMQVPGALELDPGAASEFTWEYYSANGWLQLGVNDETNGFRQSGMVQFIGPADAITAPGLAGNAYRIRARLKDGITMTKLPVSGLWLNSVWASHRIKVEQELLGIADGTPNQALRFVRAPVLSGETIEIREWTGSGEGWQIIARQAPEADLRYEKERTTGQIRAVWVRWHARSHLYDAQPQDRVYVVERATGLLRFGNGMQGMIPLAGSQIVVNYKSGGGMIGNLPPNTITQLRSAVPFIASVGNPVAALGGADVETYPPTKLASIKRRGPQQLRHLNRGITTSDIAWLVHDASPEVARARCLPITGPVGHAQRGWFTVIVLPHSADSQPMPSAELQRRIANYLRTRVSSSVTLRMHIIEPSYIQVKVVVQVIPLAIDQAAAVETRLRQRLNDYLHPLTGGASGLGWEFGENLHLSQIATLIENTDGVDYANHIQLFVEGGEQGATIEVPRHTLLCSGEHEIKLDAGRR